MASVVALAGALNSSSDARCQRSPYLLTSCNIASAPASHASVCSSYRLQCRYPPTYYSRRDRSRSAKFRTWLPFAVVVLVIQTALFLGVYAAQFHPERSEILAMSTVETVSTICDEGDTNPDDFTVLSSETEGIFSCSVTGGRLPRLLHNDHDAGSSWLPLHASAWLLPNTAEPGPADYILAARRCVEDPSMYTVLPLPVITGEILTVRLTPREVIVKGLILKTLRTDKYKAACLAVGLEKLERSHYKKGRPDPPDLPFDWSQAERLLLRASGPRCRMNYYLRSPRHCLSCVCDDEDVKFSTKKGRQEPKTFKVRYLSRKTQK